MKIVPLDPNYWPRGGYGHWCPGCNSGHEIDTVHRNSWGAVWTFNGDLERPSFTPSVNMQINPKGHKHYQPEVASEVCHYFITDGRIIYCGDSTHALSGKTVDLPDLPPQAFSSSQHLQKLAARSG